MQAKDLKVGIEYAYRYSSNSRHVTPSYGRLIEVQPKKSYEREAHALHLPDWVTPSSRIRIARVLGCYGVK